MSGVPNISSKTLVIRLTALVIALTFMGVGAVGYGQDLKVHYRAEFPDYGARGGSRVQLHRPQSGSGWALRLVSRRQGKTLALTTLPEWVGAPYYRLNTKAASVGSAKILLFEAIPGEGAPPTAETYQVAFAYGSTPQTRNKIWRVAAEATYSQLDGGEKLLIEEDKGRVTLKKTTSSTSTICGDQGSGYQKFVPDKLTFRSEVDLARLERTSDVATVSLPKEPFQATTLGGYFLWYSASSDQLNPDDSVTVIRPIQLGDRVLQTAWIEGGGHKGKGEFVTARINPALRVKGFRIFPGHGAAEEFDSFRKPKKLLISTQNERFVVELPDTPRRTLMNRGGLVVRFPTSVRTNCMSVVLLETRPGTRRSFGKDQWKSRSTAISEITPITELYGLSRADAALVVVEKLLKEEDPRKSRRLALLATSLGDDLVKELERVVRDGSEDDRARVAPLLRYLPAERSVPVLLELFEQVDSNDGSYLAIKRSLVTHRELAAPQLVEMLHERPPDNARKHTDLIRLVGRLGSAEDLHPLVDDLGKGSYRVRQERIRAIARGAAPMLPALFSAIEIEVNSAASVDALQAINSIGRKLHFRGQGRAPGSEVLVRSIDLAKIRRIQLLVIRSLQYFETDGAVEKLGDMSFTTQDPLTRKVTVESLARYSGPAARRFVEQRLKDPSPDVRIQAAEGLESRDDKFESALALWEYVEKETWPLGLKAGLRVLALSGDEKTLKRLQEFTLEKAHEVHAEITLEAVLKADKSFDASAINQLLQDPKVTFLSKRHCVDMLGVDLSVEGQALLNAIKDSKLSFPEYSDRRQESLLERSYLSIGKRRTPENGEILLDVLRNQSEEHLQRIALRGLGFFGDESISVELVTLREGASNDLRGMYDDTIAMINRRAQLKEMKQTIEDVDERIQELKNEKLRKTPDSP